MKLEIYQIDAFAHAIFEGNPAAVCVLDTWLPDVLMQAIAGEMNLAETAFLVKKNDGYRIRWFTPTTEVKLCGHATLASAHVLYEHLNHKKEPIRFYSQSGVLIASPESANYISLDFPANPPKPLDLTQEMIDALGGNPISALADDDLIVVYSDATEIEILSPDISKVAKLPYRGVIATAPGNGNGYDFVCRFFAPAVGVNEDPVTGSAYTELAPYYFDYFKKQKFLARQMSKRGGDVNVTFAGDRVHIAGAAKTALIGSLYLK
ncbi:PhzF family phenazine biosynthesis protein [Agarilytica rhodophyticola]|uniref:PhzF family phenazine biosynthesis protein n=1 Tax=Agarilytica rhodophyticola TaxID=1737490 RepID=UPI000B3473A0|nr:PhzF family phenazine biosynthesis protein [Agarilytica rhodophyticola]